MKSKNCTKWPSFTAKNSNKKKKPSFAHQSLLKTFLEAMQRQFAERIRNRDSGPARDNDASAADTQEGSPLSHSSSINGLGRAGGRGTTAEGLRQVLEKLTKKFNATCSINKKIRNEINVFRKERTLYDHVFKNLESLILGEEKRLLGMLRRNNEVAVSLRGADESFQNIVEMVKKSKNEDFVDILKEEKSRYDDRLRKASDYGKKSIVINLKNPERVEEPDTSDSVRKSALAAPLPKAPNHRMSRMGLENSMALKGGASPTTATPRDFNEMRILLIEKCVKDFKLITEENSLEVGMEMVFRVAQEKEEKQQAVMALELEVRLAVRGARKGAESRP